VEEPAGCVRISAPRHHDVNDLAELIDRPLPIAPAPSHLQVGLVHQPAVSHGVTSWAGGVSQQRCDARDPPVDGGVVDVDAALGQQLLDVAIRQVEAQDQRTASTITSGGKPKPAKAD
jgi:hypothetical protein